MNPIEGHRPTRSPLHDSLAPGGIAVVGASADPTKRGYKAMVGLIKDGYRGEIYPVNPKADMILGVKAWPSVTAIPGNPEMAVTDRKSTRLNSSHVRISYAVFCLKKKKSSYAANRPFGASHAATQDT